MNSSSLTRTHIKVKYSDLEHPVTMYVIICMPIASLATAGDTEL